VLVVDDEPVSRALTAGMLSPLGFDVIQAADGSEAADKAIEHRPHAVLMDLVMPGIDGLEATQRIRRSPGGDEVVIIAVSASLFDRNRQDSLQAGCDDFLAKPMQADELLEMLRVRLGLEWVYEEAAVPDGGGEGGSAG